MRPEHEKIFVIDDEPHIVETIKTALEEEGYAVSSFQNPLEAMKAAGENPPQLIITDLIMPDLDGIEVVHKAKAVSPEINVVVITAHASLETAIGAIRAGASDYLVKPFKLDELLNSVKKGLSQKRFSPETERGSKTFEAKYRIKNLIGSTPEIKEVFGLVEKVARTESTVLVVGESGTGKEMVARAIHFQSKRRKKPFISINCAALPETLLESELFGYEKGAFTGAVAAKTGLFELAEAGTFLLDEVGEMSVNLQVKLLRVLQERVVKHLGGVKDIPVNFRLIAATSKNLPEEIKASRFREDLFYRLNVIPIVLPPLRRRTSDIPLFVYYFLGFFAQKHALPRQFKITQEAMAIFQKYAWPGNIRELENVMERVVALSDSDIIGPETARQAIESGQFSSLRRAPIISDSNLREALERYERELIDRAMQEARGNQNQAAKKLNLTRQALHYKIQKYGLKFEEV